MERIWIYLKDYKKECVFAPLFKMLEALFELFVPLVISMVIDKGIGNADKNYIVKMCFLLVGLAVIGLIWSVTAQYFAAKAAIGCATGMRYHLIKHIQGLSFSEMDTVGTSTLITRMTSDINQVQNGVNLVLRLFLRSPFIVFGAMIMAFRIDVNAALVFAAAIPALAIVVFGIMLVTRPMYKNIQARLDKVLGIIHENLTGVRVIRAFNKQDEETQRFIKANEELNHLQNFVGRISGLMNPLTYAIVNVSIIVLIWVGAMRVNEGNLTQGQVVALYNYMAAILVELIKLANLIINITKALACANRVDSIFQVKSSMQDGTILAVLDKNSEKENITEELPSEEKPSEEKPSEEKPSEEKPAEELHTEEKHSDEKHSEEIPAVEFRHVNLRYKGAGDDSLTDIDFKVMKGQTVGVIGGTGSGKSSLVGLIPRFYDVTQGDVLVNGINVKEYSMHSLRDKVGIVMQKALLFKGSIRENMRWGRKDATDDEMMEAMEISQAREFVDKKEGKLDSFVDQGGKNLSGGQRQRLTIARTVLKKTDILILDDSASALDFATDATLRKSLRGMKEAPTLFIVSQRAASIMYADKIVVLDDGQAVGIGTHDELLSTCEVYQEIYYSQFKKEA